MNALKVAIETHCNCSEGMAALNAIADQVILYPTKPLHPSNQPPWGEAILSIKDALNRLKSWEIGELSESLEGIGITIL